MVDLAADSAIFFNDFAESVRFRPDSARLDRTVDAVLNRQPNEPDNVDPHEGHRSPVIHAMLRNDATNGVEPDEVEPNISELEIEMPLGGDKRWRKINRVLRQNAGCVLLEVIN